MMDTIYKGNRTVTIDVNTCIDGNDLSRQDLLNLHLTVNHFCSLKVVQCNTTSLIVNCCVELSDLRRMFHGLYHIVTWKLSSGNVVVWSLSY
jgi:hypothetical protein